MDDTHAPLTQQNSSKGNKLWSVCIFILGIELCERLCFYTLRGSQRTFFLNAHAPGAQPKGLSTCIALQQCFTILAYMFPVAGGYIADNRLGRYRTILYFTAAYVIGTWLMDIAAIKPIMQSEGGFWLYVVACLGFVALGTGAIKPNVVNFGADQYDENDPIEAEQRVSYFQYFYMIINVGSIFSAIWTVTMATSRVQNDDPGWGFFKSYLIAAAAMTIGYLVFIAGTPKYQHREKPVHKPTVSVIVKHMTEGAAKEGRGKVAMMGWFLVPVYILLTLVSNLIPSESQPYIKRGFNAGDGMSVLSLAAFLVCCLSLFCMVYGHYNNEWVSELSRAIPGTEITRDAVRDAFRLIPTIFLINIGFSVCYNSMDIYGPMACQMDVRLPSQFLQQLLMLKGGGGQLNGNFYSLGDNLSIIIFIPLLEQVVFPAYKRRNNGRPMSRKAKYAWGFFLAILANAIAIVIEAVRRGKSTGDHPDFIPCPAEEFAKCDLTLSNTALCLCGPVRDVSIEDMTSISNWFLLSQCAGNNELSVVYNSTASGSVPMTFQLPMTNMSAWWTFIPFFITGIGEVLVNPIVQEFAYDECPSKLRSLMMGICLLAMGTVPGSITAFFTFLVPNDLNSGNLIPYFFIIIVLSCISWCLYLMIATTDRRIEALNES